MAYVAFLNTKGGSGKSTLATNLVTWFARSDGGIALVDYDPQESAMAWLRRHGRVAVELPSKRLG